MKTQSRSLLGCLVLAVLLAGPVRAEVKVSGLFTDNMVLQREKAAPVWGTADPAEKVTVQFGDAKVSAEADAKGDWMVKFPAMPASAAAKDLHIAGKNEITIKNVLVGDVWICSGQSNMEMALRDCNSQEDIAAANYPTLRRIKLEHRALAKPTKEVPGRWEVCTPESAGNFTAAGFFFARRVQKEAGVPIGLIDDNWGGTRIEPWTPAWGFDLEPSLASVKAEVETRTKSYRDRMVQALPELEKWAAETRKLLDTPDAVLPPAPEIPQNPMNDPNFATTLYNGMIHPIVPYGIKGALWYQGEWNGGEGDEYYYKMRALIGSWRKDFGQGDFPFYFVQLTSFQNANSKPEGGDGWSRLRMAQLKSLEIPKTGMAVSIDIGDDKDIHPKNKFDVGERLALWALRDEYGKKDLVVSGPLYKSMVVDGSRIRVKFDHVGGGLMAGKKEGRKPAVQDAGGKLKRFAIAGEDKQWVWAEAAIDGDSVVVSSPEVPKPVAVRYAFSQNPEGCNLYNREGLPASPFRTDSW